MVEQDISHKSSYIRSADLIVRWFVPLVLVIALATLVTMLWLGISDPGKTIAESAVIRAVSLLLISCPCAIGIAAPLAEAHLINALASMGAIIRNRGCLRFLGRETVYAFDKTGTITEGRFKVIKGLEKLTVFRLQCLKSISSQSSHPIATAIASSIPDDNAQHKMEFSKIEEFPGRGLRGILNGKMVFLGSERFLRENGHAVAPSVNREEKGGALTIVYFAEGNDPPVEILLGDKLRPDAAQVIAVLRPAKRILLSGDHLQTVAAVADACGFDDYQGQVSPLEKRERIEALKEQGNIVCMLGDGINDSPALTSAHIGVSVVTAADISIQVSDILMTTDRLDVLPKMRQLAIKGRRILHQNLFWAFFYNVAGIGLAACGLLSPIFAAFAMTISSLMVLFNARRL